MRVCVFEDQGVAGLEPLTLTRPAFDLLCGTSSLGYRHYRYFGATETGALVRPALADWCRLTQPNGSINDTAWLRAGPAVLVNARWLPFEPPTDWARPHVATVGDQVAYAVVPAEHLTLCSANTIDDCLGKWKRTLPCQAAGGWMIDHPWDLIEHNADMIRHDLIRRTVQTGPSYRPANLTVVGPSDQLLVDPAARIDPLVVADTTQGPVIIDREAVVHSFSRLEGPCHIGPGCTILGAKVRGGTTIGPACRVGGEVETSILHGHTNKYHDGFLGHSYVGEWVNLAAGVQVSDLRNDYGPIPVTINGQRFDTGLTKIGAFIGDHAKLGLNTLLNTGTVVGAFGNLLPTGTLLPKVIPSFCAFWHGQMLEQADLPALFATATKVMGRRGCELTNIHAALYRDVFQHTAARRRQVLREGEQRRLRRSA
jgi:UDP-N-acetylglucosamine diphosphorylase/glucosamine-1-phosphate N-acetyltransferase